MVARQTVQNYHDALDILDQLSISDDVRKVLSERGFAIGHMTYRQQHR